ncbi:MAG: zf-TFIIB domain-containing protein [Solirubrobacterales bacterium]
MNDTATAQLTCLKCGGEMRTDERNGITIDQCTVCHGIFLDCGELERLISAESAYLGDERRAAEDPRSGGHHGGGGKHGRKRNRGFLGELFDS